MRTALLLLAPALAAASGCAVVPHSVVLGQTAAGLGAGGAETSLSLGLGYTGTHTTGGSSSTTDNTLFQLPLVEGNFQYGISDNVTFNLHGGLSGLAPGVKVTLLRGPVELALLPSLAFGVIFIGNKTSGGSSSGFGSSSSTTNTTGFDVLAGLRVIASMKSGLYGALGYQLLYLNQNNSSDSSGGSSSGSSSSSSLTGHTLVASFGYRQSVAPLVLYWELGGLVSPLLTISQGGSSYQNQPNQTAIDWGVMGSVTLAIPVRRAAPAAAEAARAPTP